MKYIIVFLAIIHLQLFSSDENTLSGFFGYKDHFEKKEDENTTKYKKLIKQILKNPSSVTAEEFRQTFKFAKDRVVMNPQNEKDMEEFIKLENIMIHQGELLAQYKRLAKLTKPELDITSSIAKTKFANLQDHKNYKKEMYSTIKNNTDKIALLVILNFQDTGKSIPQIKVLDYLQKDFPNLTIRKVDKSTNVAKKTNSIITPDFFLVYKEINKPKFYRIGSGLLTKEEIIKNINFVYKNMIKKNK